MDTHPEMPGNTPPAALRESAADRQAEPGKAPGDTGAGRAGIGADMARWPAWAPDEHQLADLELLLTGAFRPLEGFMSAAAAEAVAARGALPDGTRWPFPVTLTVPAEAVPPDCGHLVLEDPERTPLAVLTITEITPAPEAGHLRLAGPVTALREPEHGPFRHLRRSPEAVRAELSAPGGPANGVQGAVHGAAPGAAHGAAHGAARGAAQDAVSGADRPGNNGRECREPGGEPRPVLGFVTRRPLHRCQLGQLRHLADEMKARLVLFPAVAGRAEVVERPEALVRVVVAAAGNLPADTLVVPVPLAPRNGSATEELQARAVVAAAYGATHLFADPHLLRGTGLEASGRGVVERSLGGARHAAGTPARRPSDVQRQPTQPAASPAGAHRPGDEDMAGTGLGAVRPVGTWTVRSHADGQAAPRAAGEERAADDAPGDYLPIPLVNPGEWDFDAGSEVWRPTALIETDDSRPELSDAKLLDLLDRGDPVPDWFTTEPVARELRAARPPRYRRGLVVFFTGLSGSGKSTVARDLADALSERGGRTVSLLDGDRVRQLLSAGLTFSRADRDMNIARISFVAAEVARHGGIAICAPIAPYAAARAQAREVITEAGDFVLVHVATPIEVCEERDRKGLYAKARAGVIESFTGVSDPYEEPDDADLVIDTSALTRSEAVAAVLDLMVSGGWLREAPALPAAGSTAAAADSTAGPRSPGAARAWNPAAPTAPAVRLLATWPATVRQSPGR